jgi:hypothetical protein
VAKRIYVGALLLPAASRGARPSFSPTRDHVTRPISSSNFEPKVSFTVTNPRYTIFGSETESFVARFSDPSGELAFANDRMQFLDPESEHAGGKFEPVEVGKDVDSIVVWFQEHPRLRVSEPTLVTVGGADGVTFDAEATQPYQNAACGPSECVLLWMTPNSVFVLSQEDALRLMVLDVDGETVIVTVEATRENFDEFAADAEQMLATVSFG